jgi:hypothetical protein
LGEGKFSGSHSEDSEKEENDYSDRKEEAKRRKKEDEIIKTRREVRLMTFFSA